MEITYGRSAESYILDALSLSLDEAGHVVYEDGSYVPTVCGMESQRIDRVAGFEHDESAKQETLLVCNRFPCLVDMVSDPNT